MVGASRWMCSVVQCPMSDALLRFALWCAKLRQQEDPMSDSSTRSSDAGDSCGIHANAEHQHPLPPLTHSPTPQRPWAVGRGPWADIRCPISVRVGGRFHMGDCGPRAVVSSSSHFPPAPGGTEGGILLGLWNDVFHRAQPPNHPTSYSNEPMSVGRFALWCAKLHQQGGP